MAHDLINDVSPISLNLQVAASIHHPTQSADDLAMADFFKGAERSSTLLIDRLHLAEACAAYMTPGFAFQKSTFDLTEIVVAAADRFGFSLSALQPIPLQHDPAFIKQLVEVLFAGLSKLAADETEFAITMHSLGEGAVVGIVASNTDFGFSADKSLELLMATLLADAGKTRLTIEATAQPAMIRLEL